MRLAMIIQFLGRQKYCLMDTLAGEAYLPWHSKLFLHGGTMNSGAQ